MALDQHSFGTTSAVSVKKRNPVPAILFLMVVVTSVANAWNTFITKVPYYSDFVTWLSGVAQGHIGFYTYTTVLLGAVIGFTFLTVPEISLIGLKFQNKVRAFLVGQDRELLEAERSRWDQERTRLINEHVKTVAALREELQNLTASSAADKEILKTELDQALVRVQIYGLWLEMSKNGAALCRLLDAARGDDVEFDRVYGLSMNYFALLAMKLVENQDRSLNCTIMSYDEDNDSCLIIGEAGTTPNRVQRFRPRRGVGVGGKVLQTGEPLVVPDIRQERSYVPSTNNDPLALMSIPVVDMNNRVIGLVNICSRPANSLTTADLNTVALAVDSVATAMFLKKSRGQIGGKE